MSALRKVRGSGTSCCHSRSWRSQTMLTSFSSVSSWPPLYRQCAATPSSASRSIAWVRIWTSNGCPPRPSTVVCSDWYRFGFGIAIVVLEAARNGTPDLVHDAERGVGVLHVDRDDPKARKSNKVRQIDLPAAELLVDGVVALDPVTDLGFDVRFLKRIAQALGDSPGRAPGPLDPLVELSPDVLVVVRMQVTERPVLQHALNPRHPQPVGERRVDLQRLARDPPPLPGSRCSRVSMLWRRSTSFTTMTRRSRAEARISLRKLSACTSSLRTYSWRPIFDTPSRGRRSRLRTPPREPSSWPRCPPGRRAAGRRRRSSDRS